LAPGSLAAAAMAPNDVPKAVTVPRYGRPDPAFVLIADKLAGDIAHCEAIDAQDEADEHGIGVDEADDRCWAACHAVNAIEDAGMEWPNTDAIGPDGWHYQLRATMAAAIEGLIKVPAGKAVLS